ncbi:DNA polymerase III subunit beta [Anoxynatronum buryatiense]|uniref:Beta sliding clamp n=1 Tax=Anoxynatronum buryatiense TaxID=489973 RepID=A0AA45WWL0_9CLOT|nr:DNA polymerase III subunit beta [Anoxynatronum buryatiense]SMP58354.1 DNA polymerase III, beta subunit [Anoxynatronum buryatiense]
MRFTIQQKELLKSLSIVQKGVSSKTTLPVLKGIYVEAFDQYLKLVATDLDIGIEHFNMAEIEEEGAFVVDARLFLNIVRKMPDRPIHFQMAEHRQLLITCDHISYTLHLLEVEEFPELPIINADTSFQLPQDLFKSMIQQTLFCASVDESKPSLLGLRCEMKEGRLEMVGVDGFRLALRRCRVNTTQETSFTVPVKTMSELVQILEDNEKPLQVSLTDKQVVFSMEKTTLNSRRIDKPFVQFRDILPKQHDTVIRIPKNTLFASVDRASLMVKEGKSSLIKWVIRDSTLSLTARTDLGQVHEEMPVSQQGNNKEIAFNARYFLEALRAIDDEEIDIKLNQMNTPGIIEPVEGDDWLYLVLPVRMNASEDF